VGTTVATGVATEAKTKPQKNKPKKKKSGGVRRTPNKRCGGTKAGSPTKQPKAPVDPRHRTATASAGA
jgi:hypothetical protein